MAKRTTKHALLMSGLALLLCISMLVGSTYAWFTDSVTSTGNIIKSGTLDVTMEWKDATTSGEVTTYTDASAGPIFNYSLWEPGYVEAKNLKIANVGTLALKYQLNIVATGEVSDLAKVIDVYYAEEELTLSDRTMTGLTHLGTLDKVLAQLSTTASGNLEATEAHTVTIALKMQESAGNEYQDKSIGSSFKVELMATQLTSEKDSFDDQYDKMATIDTIEEFNEALAADYDLIRLGANLAPTESIVIPEGKTVAIDLQGYSIAQTKNDMTAAYAVIVNKGTLTIEDSVGTGKINFTDTTPYTTDPGWASNTIRNEGTLTVNGGTVENLTPESVKKFGYPHAIDVYQGSVTTINGGTVKSLNYDSIRMFCNSATLATKVVINGGTIINRVSFQDPSATVAGYGILEINGGNFITTDGITANVRLLNFSNVVGTKGTGNMKATVTGGTFDKGFITSDYVSAGVKTSDWLTITGGTFASDPTECLADGLKAVKVGDAYEVVANTVTYATASTAAELQTALDNASDVNLIVLTDDIAGDVSAKQIPNLVVTINGDGHNFEGVFLIDGNSAQETSSGITLKNINFVAESISADACVNLGDGTDTWTRYTSNVTVENCTFDVPGAVGVKSYTGGDKNLKLVKCTSTARAHSMAQLKGIDGVTVDTCTVNSIRGISFNNSLNVVVTGSTFNVQKYAVRFGDDANTTVENYAIINSTLTSQCVEDAVIVLRAGALNANLTITNSTYTGPVPMIGHENANVVIN